MTTSKSSPHLLVIPFPAQGHLLPLLDVTCYLSTISPDLNITIVTTPKNLPLLSPILSACPSIRQLVLPFPSLPNFSSEHVRDIPPSSSVGSLFYALSLLQPQIISWATSVGNNPPTAIISDFFLGWTDNLAKQLGIPRFNFASISALLISVNEHLFRYGVDEPLQPLLPSDFPYDHLPSVFRRYRAHAGTPEWELVRDSMIANANSHAHVLNTFHSLDGGYLDHLRKSYGHGRVWAVGPTALRGMDVPVLPGEVATWLDRCPQKSVVYVCFGSQFRLAGDHARALAGALEASGARFLWAAGPAEVPDGFEGRTPDRGLVLRGWAPQKAVLTHGAVGSFLTHCGWNSVLEGVVAGVMLLAWPMEADQFLNARLLVDERKAAVRACVGGPNVVPDVAALAKIFADSVVDGGKFVEVKTKAEEMKRMALEAVAEGGRSYCDMEKFVRELTQLNANE